MPMPKATHCRDCDSKLTDSNRQKNNGGQCRACRRKYEAIWRSKNRSEVNEKSSYHKLQLKIIVIDVYGGECSCCSEHRLEFLSIDHVNGGGNKHRKELNRWGNGFYHWLVSEGFPDGFQVLCMNCNFAIGKFGYCPHEDD